MTNASNSTGLTSSRNRPQSEESTHIRLTFEGKNRKYFFCKYVGDSELEELVDAETGDAIDWLEDMTILNVYVVNNVTKFNVDKLNIDLQGPDGTQYTLGAELGTVAASKLLVGLAGLMEMDVDGNCLNAPITIRTKWRDSKSSSFSYQIPQIFIGDRYFGDSDLSNKLWEYGSLPDPEDPDQPSQKEVLMRDTVITIQQRLVALSLKNRLPGVKDYLTKHLKAAPADSHPVETPLNDVELGEGNVTPAQAVLLNQHGEDPDDLPF